MDQAGARILLGEDDPAQRDILNEVLALEGFQVMQAGNPSEVVEGLVSAPDLALLDLWGVTSPVVMRVLRSLPRRPAVILVSADTSLPAVARRLGVDGHVSKPYDLEDLLGEIRRALREKVGPMG